MALNRCKNGHMYSARKYGDVCPYCNTNLETTNMVNNRRLMVDDPDKTMVNSRKMRYMFIMMLL